MIGECTDARDGRVALSSNSDGRPLAPAQPEGASNAPNPPELGRSHSANRILAASIFRGKYNRNYIKIILKYN